ncbi:M15 family metallopeptidase [Isoptericola chiayiensis]|uniref:M15 family metallopeptidase n=1 Tax=Isoptericola chiayiensis TaxID=579446 RepID=UPI0015541DC4|nr:LAS superfamily LD-carboxypeptidase LdcB [Isoptericola chiayiensis]
MTRPRFTLPWRRRTRRGAHRADPRAARRRPSVGPRTAVAGAMAVLALGAGTATALTPGVATSATSAPGTDGSATPAPAAEPAEPATRADGDSDTTTAVDGKVVTRATTALQRAREVTSESTSLTAKQERAIAEQADAVAELLAARSSGAASRSSEREPLPTEREALPSASPSPLVEDDVRDEAGADDGASGDVVDDAQDGTADAVSTEQVATATKKLTRLVTKARTDVTVEAAPETPVEITAAQAAEAKAAAAKLAQHVDSFEGFANGRVPAAELRELSFAGGETLRRDAAAQLERLDVAFRARFGTHLDITDSYRSYDSQVAVRATKGYLAAVPGYSEHGWGVAVDLGGGVESFGTAEYEWLRENAPMFGWDNPAWARSGGSKPEAWHWEYTPLQG